MVSMTMCPRLSVLSSPLLLRSTVRSTITRSVRSRISIIMSIPSMSFLRHSVRDYHDHKDSAAGLDAGNSTTTTGNGNNNNNNNNNNTPKPTTVIPSRLYKEDEAPSLAEFAALCEQPFTQADYPLSASVENNIPIYNLSHFSPADEPTVSRLQDEWHHALLSGPGVFVVHKLYPDPRVIATANEAFDAILAAEASSAKGDHFAASAANARIWNSFSKHALTAPASFAEYYKNPWLPAIAAAWLGPGSRLTAQLNVVRPGGKPQNPHRDYHLGFQTAAQAAAFPKPLHAASAHLTLQGAVAHSAMPLASGPTRFLPGSQRFGAGYMAYRRPEFAEYFDGRWTSLPLGVGDGVFFSPALMHAAGENQTSDLDRSANLLQISAAFGKPMEAVDGVPIVRAVWPYVKRMVEEGAVDVELHSLLSHLAEGYPFPTNLDRRPPAPGGMAPESEVGLLLRGVREGWETDAMVKALEEMREASRA